MRLAVNKLGGLRALRALRRKEGRAGLAHCDLPAPDPSPFKRWTAKRLSVEELGLAKAPTADRKLEVAVPLAEARLQARWATNTVYGPGLPPRSFVEAGNGIAVASPELLFVEMACYMPAATHVLLGYELCGTFGRDPADPRTGDVAFGLAPATSVERIREFIAGARYVQGLDLAGQRIDYVADNAWSPLEAVLATMLSLPACEMGYGMGRALLNVRHELPADLAARGCPESRVPDVEIEGLPLGFNYDGRWHFDLDSLAAADPGEAAAIERRIREKYLDDLRRNRELAAVGKVVMPVASEDLFARGGLDAVVLEAAGLLESLGYDVSKVRAAVGDKRFAETRQKTIWSLLPWAEAPRYAKEAQIARGMRLSPGETVYL